MNTRELKAKMILQNKTADELCAAVGISRTAWFRKINGTSEFTQSEISRIRKVLDLNDRETALIFFNEVVA